MDLSATYELHWRNGIAVLKTGVRADWGRHGVSLAQEI